MTEYRKKKRGNTVARRGMPRALHHLNSCREIPHNSPLARANIELFLAGDIGSRFQFSRVFDDGQLLGIALRLFDVLAAGNLKPRRKRLERFS